MPPLPRLLLAAACLAAPLPALAEGGISLAVAGGGIGVDPVAGVRVTPELGGHGDAALLAISRHFQSGPAQDADHLKLRSAAAMIDLFPFGGDLRFSLGARYECAVHGVEAGVAAARLRAGRGVQSIGPVATFGWTRRLARGLVAVAEAGATLRRAGPLAGAAPFRAAPLLSAQLGWRF